MYPYILLDNCGFAFGTLLTFQCMASSSPLGPWRVCYDF
jgi:hypothetical protein